MNRDAINVCVQGFVYIWVFISLGQSPRDGIAESCVECKFSFVRNCWTVPPEWLYDPALSPVMYEGCSFSVSCQHLVLSEFCSVLFLNHSNRCVVLLIMALFCISRMANGAEYLCMCFFAIIYPFCQALGQVFGSFLNWVVCFLTVEFWEFFFIFWIPASRQKCDFQIFSSRL